MSRWDSRTIAFSALGDLLSVGQSTPRRATSVPALPSLQGPSSPRFDQARCANELDLANILYEMQFRIARVENALSKVEESALRPAEGKSESQLSELVAQIKSEVLKGLSNELKTKPETEACTPDPGDEEKKQMAISNDAAPDLPEKPHRWRTKSSFDCLMVDANWEYEFDSSIWDSLIFIGVGNQSVVDIALHLTITLIFVIIQSSMLSVLAGGGFSSNPYDGFTQTRLKFWRATQGHSINHVNEFDSSSLASRVCSDDPALSLATNQQAMYLNIEAYMTPAYVPLMETGSLVFVCCVTIYIIQIVVDIQEAVHKLIAVCGLPYSWRWHTSLTWEDETCKLVHMSGWRRVMEMFSCVTRLVFNSLLLYYGADWLLYTTDVPSLLLNTTALTFLLSVDCDMFSMGAPMFLRIMMKSVEPLPSHTFHGRQLMPLFYLIVVISVALGFGKRGNEVMKEMTAVSDILCSQNLQFAASISKSLGVHWAKTTKYDPDQKMSEWADGRYYAVMALVQDYDKDKLYTEKLGTVNLVAGWTSGTTEFMVKQAKACEDRTDIHPGSLVYVVSNNAAKKAYSQCADLKAFCSSTEIWAKKLRSICAGTCECLQPDSGLVFLGLPVQGCVKPEDHDYKCNTANVKNKLKQQPCNDTPRNDLQLIPGWKTALKVISDSDKISEFDHNATLVSEIHSNLAKFGCAGLLNLTSDTRRQLCQARSIPFWCPGACGCPLPFFTDCPCTCPGAKLLGGYNLCA